MKKPSVRMGRAKDWKKVEAEKLAALEHRLAPVDWRWLQTSVNFAAPDLELIASDQVLTYFHRRNRPDRLNHTLLLTTLIWQSWIKVCAQVLEPVRGNLRSFWYQIVEPFYREHGLLEQKLGIPRVLQWWEAVGSVPTARTPQDLASRVVDRMTERLADFVWHHIFRFSGELSFEEPLDHKYIVGRDRPGILFMTEKEGLWWLCDFIRKEDPNISVMASNGQPSFLAVEYFADSLLRRTRNLAIGIFSDFDPWGWWIALNLDDKLRFMGFKSVESYYVTSTSLFTPEQIAHGHDLSQSPHQTMVRNWLEATGGVDGRPIALHIDVIPGPKMKLLARNFVKWAEDGNLDQHFQRVPRLQETDLVKTLWNSPRTREGTTGNFR